MSEERKPQVENRLSDLEFLDLCNAVAKRGGTIADVVEQTGYSRASVSARRVELGNDIRKKMQSEDLTDDEIAEKLPLALVPFKRGGGAKSSRKTEEMLSAVMERIS